VDGSMQWSLKGALTTQISSESSTSGIASLNTQKNCYAIFLKEKTKWRFITVQQK